MWRRENVTNAVKQMEQMGLIRKNQASADDILNGNVKIILSLCRIMINYCEEHHIQVEGLDQQTQVEAKKILRSPSRSDGVVNATVEFSNKQVSSASDGEKDSALGSLKKIFKKPLEKSQTSPKFATRKDMLKEQQQKEEQQPQQQQQLPKPLVTNNNNVTVNNTIPNGEKK